MADVFELYRFTKARIVLLPSACEFAVGFMSSFTDTNPNTVGGIMELPCAQMLSAAETMRREINLTRQELIGDNYLKWWKTIPGTPADQFEIQGRLYFAATGTFTSTMYVEWEIEFSQWCLAAQSPYVLIDPDSGLYRKVPPQGQRQIAGAPPNLSGDGTGRYSSRGASQSQTVKAGPAAPSS
jgi:hypothetical protein